jgi:hypothetical protein
MSPLRGKVQPGFSSVVVMLYMTEFHHGGA